MTENQYIGLGFLLWLFFFLKPTERTFIMLTLTEQSLTLWGKVRTMSIAGKRCDRN